MWFTRPRQTRDYFINNQKITFYSRLELRFLFSRYQACTTVHPSHHHHRWALPLTHPNRCSKSPFSHRCSTKKSTSPPSILSPSSTTAPNRLSSTSIVAPLRPQKLEEINHHSKMEKTGVLNFKVGQLAEIKTFEKGYRGAWFRCKIRDFILKENKILPEYYDFPEEVITWANIYEVPPYGGSSKEKRQLMVRPHYPVIYRKSQMPPPAKISEVCVIIDGTWKAGDLVDWNKDDCWWSARVSKVLSRDKVKIKLPLPPAGEGVMNSEHDAFSDDLRPSLDWSATKGWTLLTEGQTSCSAELIFPCKQGMAEEITVTAGYPVNSSSTSRISVSSVAEGVTSEKEGKMMDDDDVNSYKF